MASKPLKLDDLPLEIIRRIAAYGPCESALTLLKVNRALHNACHDLLVFKSIIDNGNGPARQLPPWQCTTLSNRSSVSLWARYALADSKAARMPEDTVEETGVIVDGFLEAVPQLLASHHPLIDFASPVYLLDSLNAVATSDQGYCNRAKVLSFCLAARSMSCNFLNSVETWVSGGHIPGELPWASAAFRLKLQESLRQPLHDLEAPFSPIYDNIDLAAQGQMIANKAASSLSYELRIAISCGRIRTLGQMISPPSAIDIPFPDLMELPLPFCGDAIERFGECHLGIMTSPEFLESGEWAGYYCYSHRANPKPIFDPPMSKIRFLATRINGNAMRISLHGTGVDSIDTFDLIGEIDTRSGKASIEKLYNNRNFSWHWSCVMTPFGIVGNWGRSNMGGWLWLWKTSWVCKN